METPGQVELDLSEAAARPGGLLRTQYAAGDHVALAPENDPAEAAALRKFGLQISQARAKLEGGVCYS